MGRQPIEIRPPCEITPGEQAPFHAEGRHLQHCCSRSKRTAPRTHSRRRHQWQRSASIRSRSGPSRPGAPHRGPQAESLPLRSRPASIVLLSMTSPMWIEGRTLTLSTLLQHWTGPVLQFCAAARAANARVETAAMRENIVMTRSGFENGLRLRVRLGNVSDWCWPLSAVEPAFYVSPVHLTSAFFSGGLVCAVK